jgi:hypothetical protein
MALFVGTHLPSGVASLPGRPLDKVPHFVGFAGLAVILAMAWQTAAGKLAARHRCAVWIVVALYGALDEWTQSFVGRQSSVGDWIADVLGAGVALAALHVWHRQRVAPSDSGAPHSAASPRLGREWFRYSLKALFAVLTLVSVGCFWLMLPTLHAQRFAAAMEASDYAAAESLFESGGDVFPGSFKQSRHFHAGVHINPLQWEELLRGERRISVAVDYGDGHGIAACAADIRATHSGLRLEIIVP